MSDIENHIPVLLTYAAKCPRITEMGVRSGESTKVFLQTKPQSLVSIDWDKPPYEVCRQTLAEVEKIADLQGISFKFISADSTSIEIDETDLLYIDTWHMYEQLLLELLTHSSKTKKYIICHDTNESIFPGMTCAIEDFLSLNPQWDMEIMLLDLPGLTVLERVGDSETNWGVIKKQSLLDEVKRQVEMYYEDCSDGVPKSPLWIEYTSLQKKRFRNEARWPKTFNIGY